MLSEYAVHVIFQIIHIELFLLPYDSTLGILMLITKDLQIMIAVMNPCYYELPDLKLHYFYLCKHHLSLAPDIESHVLCVLL